WLGHSEQVTALLLFAVGRQPILVLRLSNNERKSMRIILSKLYYCSILCRGMVPAVIVLTSCISSQAAQAAAGDLDPTFGIGGKVMTDLKRSTDIANAVAVQADGQLVVVGQTYKNNDFSNEDFAVARYNTDGTLDTSFGAAGRVRTDFPGLAA